MSSATTVMDLWMEKKMENVFILLERENGENKRELKEFLQSPEFLRDLSSSEDDYYHSFFINFWHQFFFFEKKEKKNIKEYHTILFRHAFSIAFKKLLNKIDYEFSKQELEFLKLYIDYLQHLQMEKRRREYMYDFLYDFCASSSDSRAHPEYFMGLIHGSMIDKQSTIGFLRFLMSLLPFQNSISPTVRDLYFMCFTQGTSGTEKSGRKVIEKDHVMKLLQIVSPAPTRIILRVKRPRKEDEQDKDEINDDDSRQAHYICGMEEF